MIIFKTEVSVVNGIIMIIAQSLNLVDMICNQLSFNSIEVCN